MSSSEGNHKSAGAIRARAQQLGAGGVHDTAEAELLAAIADGTLSFEQIDDDSLARCVGAFGPGAVVQAFVQAANDSQVSEKPAKIAIMPASVSAISRKHTVGTWRTSNLSWVAARRLSSLLWVQLCFSLPERKKTGRQSKPWRKTTCRCNGLLSPLLTLLASSTGARRQRPFRSNCPISIKDHRRSGQAESIVSLPGSSRR